eukprot:6237429-Prymnesium_polylepis.1
MTPCQVRVARVRCHRPVADGPEKISCESAVKGVTGCHTSRVRCTEHGPRHDQREQSMEQNLFYG